MRLLQLNAWYGRVKHVLISELEQLQPDIACMQEIVDYEKWFIGIVGPHTLIQKSLGLDHSYFSPLLSMDVNNAQMRFGNAIYSRYALVGTSTHYTRGEYTANFDREIHDINVRAFQHASTVIDGKTLHLINHHGHHIDEHKNGDEETEKQTRMIAEYAAQLTGAVIICGDFNLTPESPSMRVFDKQFRNLASEYGLTTTRSALTPKKEVCDYILVNDQVHVNDFSMIDAIISDHNGLLLDFNL